MIGKTVAQVRYLSNAELAEEGWGGRVAAIEFTDGTIVYAASDAEGNDSGTLMARTPDGNTEFVVPTSRPPRGVARA